MAPFAFSIKEEGKDSAISCEGDGHSLLGCRGVDFDRIPGTWAKHHCCSLCPDIALRDKRPGRNIIILHDNALPHTARLTSEAIAKMGWEVLPHPSYSPDLAPSDYHRFGFMKDQLRGQRYETTEAIQKAVRLCLPMAGTEFYRRGIFKLPERWGNVYKEVAIMWKNKERSVD